MASELHHELILVAVRWLRKNGFAVIATELSAAGCVERPDVIAFRSGCSVVIESKISRSDFLADAKKPHRSEGGLGLYRFFICPPGVIEKEDLPEKWGLLHVDGRKITEVVRPKGNIWPDFKTSMPGWDQFKHAPNYDAERNVLFSIARRLSKGEAAIS